MARVPIDIVISNRSGRVVSGVSLFVYDRGTTDQVDVYDADTAGSLVTQPLTSDAEGRFPDCWVAGGAYDLYSPDDSFNGTQPWEAVVGVDTQTVGVLRDAPFNILDPRFSVPVDGTSDCTAAFGVVRDAVGAGGHVYVPRGTYVLDNLTLSVAGQRWTLAPGAILKLKDTASGGVVVRTTAEHITIEGGEIDGNNANNGGQSTSSAALLIRASHSRVIGVFVHDSCGYGILAGTAATGTPLDDVEIRSCAVKDSVATGIAMNAALVGTPTVPSTGLRIVNCWSDNSAVAAATLIGAGFAVVSSNATDQANRPRGVVISGCYSKSRADASGADMAGFQIQYCAGAKVSDCESVNHNFAGFTCAQSRNVAVSGCTARGNVDYGFEFVGEHMAITGCTVDGDGVTVMGIALNSVLDGTVAANTIRNLAAGASGPYGIQLVKSGITPQRIAIVGNNVHSQRFCIGAGDVLEVLIEGNNLAGDTASGTGRYGVRVLSATGGVKRLAILSNQIFDCNSAGVLLDAGSALALTNVVVSGNAFHTVSNPALILSNITLDNTCIAAISGFGSVASAASITLPNTAAVTITGTTTITSVVASYTGRVVTLKFAGILTFTDGSNLKLNGDFVTSADDTITLVCDGTNWFELARSAN